MSASLYGGIDGDLTGAVSGFERIIRLDIDGQVQSSIASGADLTTLGSWFEFGSVSSAGSLTIDRLQRLSIAGNLAGNITADSLTSLIEIGGSQTGTSAITLGSASGNVEVSGTLLRLVVSGAMTGDILAGNLGGTSLPPVNIGTTFTGSLICNGDVNNVVRLGTDWAGTDELFIIGGSLPNRPDDTGPQGNRMILLVDPSPSSGTTSNILEHQIVINANRNGGDWLGDVSVNFQGNGNPTDGEILIGPNQPQPLRVPRYEALSSTLGGGAVGLVPFAVHRFDSTPSLGGTLFVTASISSTTLQRSITLTPDGPFVWTYV